MDVNQFVTFLLGREQFAIEVAQTREILDIVPITRIPQSPDYLLGVINLRGQVVPVVDLRRKLGMPAASDSSDSCILVVEFVADGRTLTLGAMADAVCEVAGIGAGQIEPPPRLGHMLNAAYLKGIAKIDGAFVMLLDIGRIMTEEECRVVMEAGEEFLLAEA